MNSFERPITPGFLLRFTLPGMLMMLFNSFYTMVDGGFVSNYVGTDALSAINIVFPLINFVLAVGIMLATGGSAVTARQMGEKEPELARQSFSLLTVFTAGLGIVIAVLSIVFADPIVWALGSTDVLYEYCRDYLVFMSLFTPCCMLQILFQFFFTTAGRPNLGLAATLLGGVANMVLDYVLIVPLHMGIRGAAIATGIGQTIPTVIGLVYFFSRRNDLLYYVRPVLRGWVLGRACLNGSSEMVSNLAVAVTTFLFNIMMLSYLGEDGVAAITIVFYAQFFFTAIFFGYTSGVAPLISFHFGAQNHDRLKKLVRLSLLFVAVCSLLAYGLSVVLSQTVVGIFAQRGTAVFSIASDGMELFAIGFLFMGFNIFASGLFTALSNGIVSAVLSFLRTFVFLVAAIELLPKLWGVSGVWLAIPAAELLALVVSLACILRYRKRYQYL
ncbi:MATE family efflux transporter [Butyricicoccus sp.]|uniref:MATE family efflux transporter n=1 Tax=Butyricicoccus sp. TaxID=2049021 RepID=UPI003734C63B